MTTMESVRSRRHIFGIVLASIVGLVAGGATAWAVVTVIRPADDPLEAPAFTFVRVESGEVSSSFQLNTLARWAAVPVGVNRASGIITEVKLPPGAEVDQGAELYTVDMRPVIVAQGEVPAYRDIARDATGPDVRQLQGMLTSLGYYSGGIDGKVGSRTEKAISAWQKAIGLEATGVVGMADVVFVPRLPTRLTLDQEMIKVGANLGGGEEAILGLPDSPNFAIPVTAAQAASIPLGTRIEITSPSGGLWPGVADRQDPDPETGEIAVKLTSPQNGPVCQQECDLIPLSGTSSLSSKVVTLESVQGLMIPSAAIATGAGGQLVVITESGGRVPVSVVASAKGMSIVTGVEQGQKVRIPA